MKKLNKLFFVLIEQEAFDYAQSDSNDEQASLNNDIGLRPALLKFMRRQAVAFRTGQGRI